MRFSVQTLSEVLAQGRQQYELLSEYELLEETLTWLHAERGLTFVSAIQHGEVTLMVFRSQGEDHASGLS